VRVHRHLTLLHRLEERRLRLGRRTIDLVGQEDVGEHAAGPELELALGPVPHRHTGDVGGQQVGRELDPSPRATDGTGDRLRQGRLAHAGDVLDQEMALREQADEPEADRLLLAPDHLLDVGEHCVEEPVERGMTGRGRRLHGDGELLASEGGFTLEATTRRTSSHGLP
jgi:hypothetical protein